MRPLKTFLTKPLRRAFMFLLIGTFCIVAPLSILYASGIQYNFDSGDVEETGVLTVDIEPEYARVIFNGIRYEKKMPYLFSYQRPGTYTVSIEKDGYFSWEKSVDIRSRETTYIHSFFLFKQSLPKLIALDGYAIQKAVPSPRGNGIFFILEKDGTNRAAVFDTDTYTLHTLSIPSETITHISWSPITGALVVTNTEKEQTRITYLEKVDGREPTPFLVADQQVRVFWSQKKWGHQPYFIADNTLFRLEQDHLVTMAAGIMPVAYYNDIRDELIEYDGSTGILRITKDDKTQQVELPQKPAIIEIIGGLDNGFLAKTEKETVLLTLRQNTWTTEILGGIQQIFQPEKERWLVFSETELWTVHTTGLVTLENTSGDATKGVFPLANKENLFLLATDNELIAVNPSYATRQRLLLADSIEVATTNPKHRQIYFVGKIENRHGLYILVY